MTGVLADRRLFLGTFDGVYRVANRHGRGESHRLDVPSEGPACVHVDLQDPSVVYAGSRVGLHRSVDGGDTWARSDRGLANAFIWTIAQHPRTGQLYAGTEPAAIFASADRGESWRSCGDLLAVPTSRYWSFPLPPHESHVRGLGFAAEDPDLIMCAIEEGWLARSGDGGETWENIREGTDFDSHAVAFLPDTPTEVLATSGYGLYRSSDAGRTFGRVTAGLDRRYFTAPYLHPSRCDTVYTAAASVIPPLWRRPEGADSAVYRSDDRGRTWLTLSNGLPTPFHDAPTAIAGDHDEPATVVIGTAAGALWATTDGGESFTVLVEGLPTILSVAVI